MSASAARDALNLGAFADWGRQDDRLPTLMERLYRELRGEFGSASAPAKIRNLSLGDSGNLGSSFCTGRTDNDSTPRGPNISPVSPSMCSSRWPRPFISTSSTAPSASAACLWTFSGPS